MNYLRLKKQQEKIEKLVDDIYPKDNDKKEPIYDGIVDEKKYLNSKYKILWVLKEPYDEDDGTGGGWSLTKDLLSGKELYPNIVKGSHTFEPMVYITYSILNGLLKWNEMDYISEDENMAQVLNNIALINVNKMPARHTSKDFEIAEWYQLWKPVLLRQIQRYEPDIIIFGNTFMHFSGDLFIDEDEIINMDHTDYCIIGRKLYISAYHPAQRQVSREDYVNEIISIVSKWEKK